MRPQGKLQLTIHADDGVLVAERRASNRVLRSGAQIIAGLFSGTRSTGINKVGFGFGTDPLPVDGIGLRQRVVDPVPPNSLPSLELAPTAPLTTSDFTVESGPDAVMVNIRLSFIPAADVRGVSEAALFADQDLYNHVLFEPVDMKTGETITFYWEITFPFGN